MYTLYCSLTHYMYCTVHSTANHQMNTHTDCLLSICETCQPDYTCTCYCSPSLNAAHDVHHRLPIWHDYTLSDPTCQHCGPRDKHGFWVAPLACCETRLNQSCRMPCVSVCVCVWKFFFRPISMKFGRIGVASPKIFGELWPTFSASTNFQSWISPAFFNQSKLNPGEKTITI